MQWSAGFILSGSPAPSVCHHTEQTSLNLLFIAGASQRSPWWHINNSLQRDASLFSRSAEANEKHSYWLTLPLLIPPSPPQPINDNHCFPFVHYDPGSSIKGDWNVHFLCAGGDVGFPEGGELSFTALPPKSLSRGGTHNKWQTRRPPLSLSLFTQSEKHSHCRPESVTRPNKSWRETQLCDCNTAGVFLPLFVLAGLHYRHRVVIMFNTFFFPQYNSDYVSSVEKGVLCLCMFKELP